MTPQRLCALVAAALLVVSMAGCGDDEPGASASGVTSTDPVAASTQPAAQPTPTTALKPLRAGERRVTLTMPEQYVPEPPAGGGTDDYRCFLLDPKLKRDAFITGTNILPGNPAVVHHVILFRANPDQVPAAKRLDSASPGEGWTCFGNAGFESGPQLDDAPWLGAWAPGGAETVVSRGYGTPLAKGSQIVMQVHYNLLQGPQPDISATQLRLMSGTAPLQALHTMLLPTPVELPCRKGQDTALLCDREASLKDTVRRFGSGAGNTANLLYYLCGGKPQPGPTQTCVRTFYQPTTIRAAAGHMHLLGRRITVTLNPGTPQERVLLDISPWDFDDQGSRPVRPVQVGVGDKVAVTCTHSQELRDRLPAFAEAREDRYVLWGEGSTDEMCLGILTVTTP